MRARVRYEKTGKLRFVSAIDLGRLWERALRKADVPIAYSEGFSPHPKVSFPDALPLGYASTGEYAELVLAAPIELEPAMEDLNAAFPAGMAVLDAVEVTDGAPRLAKWLRASVWDLRYPVDQHGTLDAAVNSVVTADEALVDRDRKGEITTLDLRPAIHTLFADITDEDDDVHATVRATVHHVEPPMRPSEVHQALDRAARTDTGAPLAEPTLVTRVAQGEPNQEGLVEALSGDLLSPQPNTRSPKAATRDRRTARQRDNRAGAGGHERLGT